MIDIPVDKLPALEYFQIDFETFGAIMSDGILIHYVMKDIVRLITWEDIVGFGIGLGSEMILPERPEEQVREITKPEGL